MFLDDNIKFDLKEFTELLNKKKLETLAFNNLKKKNRFRSQNRK